MSRVAKYPVLLPKGVEVSLTETLIKIKGPLGMAQQDIPDSVLVEKHDDKLLCTAKKSALNADAMSGTLRSLISNMVIGVSAGFSKKLTLIGVGYKAQAQGSSLNLTLGYSHPVVYAMPSGIKVETPSPTEIIIRGSDKQSVGQVAASVRAFRPPEPYKGKGVRYSDEIVVIKETKKK